MLWKVIDRQSPANTNWHRQTGRTNDFRFSLIRDKRLFITELALDNSEYMLDLAADGRFAMLNIPFPIHPMK